MTTLPDAPGAYRQPPSPPSDAEGAHALVVGGQAVGQAQAARVVQVDGPGVAADFREQTPEKTADLRRVDVAHGGRQAFERVQIARGLGHLALFELPGRVVGRLVQVAHEVAQQALVDAQVAAQPGQRRADIESCIGRRGQGGGGQPGCQRRRRRIGVRAAGGVARA